MIRKLDPEKDRGCFIEGWLWESSAPRWFKDADRVFGPATFEDFLESSREPNRATFAIFDDRLAGLIIFTLRGSSVEVDLMARPKVPRGTIFTGASVLRDRIFNDLPIQGLYVWLPRKNYPTIRLCSMLGFRETGMTMIRGTYRARVIEWVHLSIPREVKAAQLAA